MANHGWVKTRKVMKPEQISEIIEKLNKDKFKNLLTVDLHKSTPQEPGWGEFTWLIDFYKESRVCWLNNSRHFEMRHGGGSSLIWWVDSCILNEVALVFNGTIGDEGISDKWKGRENYCPDFKSYLLKNIQDLPQEHIDRILSEEKKWIPEGWL